MLFAKAVILLYFIFYFMLFVNFYLVISYLIFLNFMLEIVLFKNMYILDFIYIYLLKTSSFSLFLFSMYFILYIFIFNMYFNI